jgi:uncharacterized protein YndB with AHSA1/START domain
MLTDPVATAGLVTRQVRTGSRDGRPSRIVVARRTYDTDQADLWDAVTDQERLPRWFAPVHGDLRLGGRFQVEGNAGGVVESCDEPTSFTVTWEMGDTVSWVAVTLVTEDRGATLEIAHEALADAPGALEFWAQFGPGAVGVGWDLALVGLGLHLETGQPLDMSEALAFTLTPAGVAFVGRAAEGWAGAAAADGDDPGAAREAAERTVAFYTTEPDDAPPADGGTGT